VYKSLHTSKENAVVVLHSLSDKAFCAGGDIRAIYDDGKEWQKGQADGKIASGFFREEYQLNYLIATLPQPQVALLNGYTMGGGVGISVHGKFRVATENTVFSMPETGIGFFCDVGGSYFLPRLPKSWGMYLGLTGARLQGESIQKIGIATHFVPAARIRELEAALFQMKDPTVEKVNSLLNSFHVSKSKDVDWNAIDPNHAAIERCFGKDSLQGVVNALNAEKTEWAQSTLAKFSKMSPTSLRVVFEQLKRGRTLDIAKCLEMEYAISQAMMRNNDFYEGVRALLVDKDKKPIWKPATLAEVKDEDVKKYFIPPQDNLVLGDLSPNNKNEE